MGLVVWLLGIKNLSFFWVGGFTTKKLYIRVIQSDNKQSDSDRKKKSFYLFYRLLMIPISFLLIKGTQKKLLMINN